MNDLQQYIAMLVGANIAFAETECGNTVTVSISRGYFDLVHTFSVETGNLIDCQVYE